MPSPIIVPGDLNRLVYAAHFANNASFDITADLTTLEGIRLALEGDLVEMIQLQASQIGSPAPYVPVSLTFSIVKTLPVANTYKSGWEQNAKLGNSTVYSDAETLAPFDLLNLWIANVSEMSFAGRDPALQVRLRGYYLVNQSLYP